MRHQKKWGLYRVLRCSVLLIGSGTKRLYICGTGNRKNCERSSGPGGGITEPRRRQSRPLTRAKTNRSERRKRRRRRRGRKIRSKTKLLNKSGLDSGEYSGSSGATLKETEPLLASRFQVSSSRCGTRQRIHLTNILPSCLTEREKYFDNVFFLLLKSLIGR